METFGKMEFGHFFHSCDLRFPTKLGSVPARTWRVSLGRPLGSRCASIAPVVGSIRAEHQNFMKWGEKKRVKRAPLTLSTSGKTHEPRSLGCIWYRRIRVELQSPLPKFIWRVVSITYHLPRHTPSSFQGNRWPRNFSSSGSAK